MKNNKIYTVLAGLVLFAMACSPYVEEKPALGEKPAADFNISEDTAANSFIFTSTSSDAFLYNWELGNGSTAEGAEAQGFYQFKGDYEVTLTAFGEGGHSSITKILTVEEDAPTNCTGVLELLTECGSKTWVLEPAENALQVGPPGGYWWGNSAADVTTRSCLFNDEYIFHEDGTFEYKTNGDVWVDDEGGAAWPTDIGLPIGCTDVSNWPAKYEDWLSGTFTYTVQTAGDTTITLNGSGAHLGLYKAGTNGTVDAPQASTVYPVASITENKIVLKIDYDWGYWQFTLVPK